MSYGYSHDLVEANKAADRRLLGVALGRLCISRGISVSEISEQFGVSRMTVYNWFRGATLPTRANEDLIRGYLVRYTKHRS